MESLKNKQKRESNSKVLSWIKDGSLKFLPTVILISALSAVTALGFVLLALISKQVLDIATGETDGSLIFNGALLLGVILMQILLNGADCILRDSTSAKLTISFRNRLFSAVCRKKYTAVSEYHSGDLLTRLTSDVDVVVGSVVNIIPRLASMLTQIAGAVIAIVALDWRVALIILGLGVTVPAIGRVFNRKYKALHKKCQSTDGQARSFIQECFENIVVIKTFVSEAPFFKKLNQYMKENYRFKMKRSWLSVITSLGLYSFFTVGYYALLLWGADGISKGAITYGTLLAFLQLVSQLRAPLQNISGIIPQYYSAIASAERLMEIEDCPQEKASAEKKHLKRIVSDFQSIEVENVTFGYKDCPVLENCSLKAQKGSITAITGESGSGKSTLFKILLGLYEPQRGNITLNGDIKVDSSLRGLFAYVPQGNMILSGTVRENITLCNDAVSQEEIIKAAKAACIYDIIEELPDGLDTKLQERGGGLSEGQLQRISIARALLTDAPILLFDEATSALDEETETRLLRNIKAMSEKTVLFVTHRNTSLKVCDKIVRVEDRKFEVIKE